MYLLLLGFAIPGVSYIYSKNISKKSESINKSTLKHESAIDESVDSGKESNVDYVQWYLEDSEGFNWHTNMLAWAMDDSKGKANIDISYEDGMKSYSKKRDVKLAVIDSKEEHGKRIYNIINDNTVDDSYKSICENCGIETFLVEIDYEKLDEERVLSAIKEAEESGASICVMAFATTIYSEKIKECMEKSEMLFVTPAGNDGVEISDFKVYPAMYILDNVLVVGDERCDGKKSDLSNYSRNYVDLFAPGTDIACIDEEGMSYESGTSYACAIVAGICAIVEGGSDIEYNNKELKNYICSLCIVDSELSEYAKYGRISKIGDYLQSK